MDRDMHDRQEGSPCICSCIFSTATDACTSYSWIPCRLKEPTRSTDRYYFSAVWVKKAVVSLRFPHVVSHVLEQEGSGTGHGCAVFTGFPNIFRGLGAANALQVVRSRLTNHTDRSAQDAGFLRRWFIWTGARDHVHVMLSTFHFICYCMFRGDSSEVSPQHYNSPGSTFQQDSCPLVLLHATEDSLVFLQLPVCYSRRRVVRYV
jgi:hypothetical protein